MKYLPTIESVKTHPLPNWYHDAKIGIFIHWGLYSLPAFAPKGEMDVAEVIKGEAYFGETPYAEWYQNSLRIKNSSVHRYHRKTYGADFSYEQFGPQFNQTIQAWDPDSWADLFARAGARYVVLVSKHHDGFLMWNSDHPNPHIPEWQTGRDIAGELTQAVSANGMKMGFYYSSLLDWSFTKRPIKSAPDLIAGSDTSRAYRDYVEKHWLELIKRYDPWILWSDIGYPPDYDLPKLFAHFYNHKPDGVINDRWAQLPKFFYSSVGRYILSQMLKRITRDELPSVPHSDFITPEYYTLEKITTHKWETCRGIGNSFGYNQFEQTEDYKTAEDFIRMLADIVSKNGNLLLNIGPRADGTLHPAQVQALEGLGAWLKENGEVIYGTRPWKRYKDSGAGGGQVRYTARDGVLYATVIEMPTGGVLSLPLEYEGSSSLLATAETLPAKRVGGYLNITLPARLGPESIPVIKFEKRTG